MPISPKIAIPLKTTKDLDWSTPLQSYIRHTYGNSENFSNECQLFNRLRQDITGAGSDATGRDLYYKYYGQLELLDLRISVEDGGCKAAFTWFDAFTHEEKTQSSLAFEKASVLFNLASINSHVAVDATEPPVAYNAFQAASGIYTFVAENFLHAPSADLNRDTVRALANLMLAQAQEVFVERQLSEGGGTKKPLMVAKLAKGANVMYKTAVEGLSAAAAKGWGERNWVSLANVHQYYMDSVAHYYQGLEHSAKGKVGLAIAYTKSAISKVEAALASYIPPPYLSFSEILNTYKTQLTTSLASLEKDNDYVYHDTIPPTNSIDEVGKLNAAKPTPMSGLYKDQDITQLIGRDIFEKLIPVSVAEQSSLYSEEKAKILRAEGENVDIAEEELVSALEYLGLPAALKQIKSLMHSATVNNNGGVDDQVADWARAIQLKGFVSFADIDQKKREIYQIVEKCGQDLDAEEREDQTVRAQVGQYWMQSPSAPLTTTLRSDLRSIKESLLQAATSDHKLQAQYATVQADVEILAKGPNSPELLSFFRQSTASISGVTQGLGNLGLSKGKADEASPIDVAESCLKRLTKIKRERGIVFTELKDKIQEDDISSLLILNKKVPNIEEKLFKSELEKYVPYQQRLAATVFQQSSTLQELTTAWKKVLDDPVIQEQRRNLGEAGRRKQSMNERFKRAYESWSDVYAGKTKGATFYNDLHEFAVSTQWNVKEFVDNRRDERRRMLMSMGNR
ncbi:BRO1-like domain-containing protein [Limtongia smithiae]|uniref:BRO1-like domain-containing protein n=1 Tax=Limtongia smithiae TaxID=1125753 RepID=UPI0034CE16B5